MEHAGEVKGIAEPGLIGHLLDHHAGLLEALGGVVHFQAEQILIGGAVVESLEQAAEVGLVDVAFVGDLAQRLQPQGVLPDVLPASLKGREGERL